MMDAKKLAQIQWLNGNMLRTTLELDEAAQKIQKAVDDPEDLKLLDIEETRKTLKRLHGEALETNVKVADLLNGSET